MDCVRKSVEYLYYYMYCYIVTWQSVSCMKMEVRRAKERVEQRKEAKQVWNLDICIGVDWYRGCRITAEGRRMDY